MHAYVCVFVQMSECVCIRNEVLCSPLIKHVCGQIITFDRLVLK